MSSSTGISFVDLHVPKQFLGWMLSDVGKQEYPKLKQSFKEYLVSPFESYKLLLEISDQIDETKKYGINESNEFLSIFMEYVRIHILSGDSRVIKKAVIFVDFLVKNNGYRIHNLVGKKIFMKTMSKVGRRKLHLVNSFENQLGLLIMDMLQAWGEAFQPRRALYPHIYGTYLNLKYKYHIRFLRPDFDPTRVPIFLGPLTRNEYDLRRKELLSTNETQISGSFPEYEDYLIQLNAYSSPPGRCYEEDYGNYESDSDTTHSYSRKNSMEDHKDFSFVEERYSNDNIDDTDKFYRPEESQDLIDFDDNINNTSKDQVIESSHSKSYLSDLTTNPKIEYQILDPREESLNPSVIKSNNPFDAYVQASHREQSLVPYNDVTYGMTPNSSQSLVIYCDDKNILNQLSNDRRPLNSYPSSITSNAYHTEPYPVLHTATVRGVINKAPKNSLDNLQGDVNSLMTNLLTQSKDSSSDNHGETPKLSEIESANNDDNNSNLKTNSTAVSDVSDQTINNNSSSLPKSENETTEKIDTINNENENTENNANIGAYRKMLNKKSQVYVPPGSDPSLEYKYYGTNRVVKKYT